MEDKKEKMKKKTKKRDVDKSQSTLADDQRFCRVNADPKFRDIPRKERKTIIDQRFASMFTTDKFSYKSKIDKRGRPVAINSDQHLKRLYQLSSDEEDSDNDKTIEEEPPINIDLARGDGNLSSESDSSNEKLDHGWAELDRDAPSINEATNRLAICNMDWERVRAADLLFLLNSFKPDGGVIHSITIYQSNYGRERMAFEDVHGPMIESADLKQNVNEDDDNNDDEEVLSRERMEAVRQYQLDRLKYYYAIVECDSTNTASIIYDQCDGIEYESSAVRLDIRFVPVDMQFDEPIRDSATFDSVNVDKYKPRVWETDALQKSNIRLTWDATDPERVKTTRAAFTADAADLDQLNDMVAEVSSDDDVDEASNCNEKLKSLLNAAGIDRNKPDDDAGAVDMEVAWSGFTEEQKKKKDNGEISKFHQYQLKRKEKKKQHKMEIKEKKRAAKQQLYDVDREDTTEKSTKIVKDRSKKKSKSIDTKPSEFELDIDDNRFSALYHKPAFTIDRSDPNYRATTGMQRLVEKKVMNADRNRKLFGAAVDGGGGAVDDATDDNLLLTDALKSKTQLLNSRKRNFGSRKK